MRKTIPLLVMASIFLISSVGTTWAYKFGRYDSPTWSYTTSVSYNGSCGTGCYKYYSSSINFCAINGYSARAHITSNYYSFDFWKTHNAGGTWTDIGESSSYSSPYYDYWATSTWRGDWNAPGNCAAVYFMKMNYKYSSGGTQYTKKFQGPSCDCIE